MNALRGIARRALVRKPRVEQPTRIWWAAPGAEIPLALILAIETREADTSFRNS
jgi:hypothetical protein